VQSAAHFGQSSPIVQVTSKAPTPEAAVHSANIVGSAVVGELARMQRAQRVDPGYWIKALPVDVANTAQLQASGQLRALVGVLAIGAILLFIVVSVVDALAGLRAERRTRRAVPEAMPDDFAPDFWPPANPVPDFDHDGQVVGREEPADDLPGGVGQDLRADFSVATFARGDGATRPTDQQSGTGRWARRSANF
jgi:hypothetical protein